VIRKLPVVLALGFLLFHLPYLPQSLEDLDSINFALGIHDFDVARHQPHPPGYPIFILLARGAYRVIGSEPRALAAVSVVAGALGVIAIAALFRRVGSPDGGLLATLIAITAPLYWFTSARPLSDMAGLAAAVAVQALILGAATPRGFAAAAFLAALAVGIRSQVAWLTAPLLLYRWKLSRENSELKMNSEFFIRNAQFLLSYAAGALAWIGPLVVVSGGPAAYWRALAGQGSADLSAIRMLWTTPTAREFVDALYYAFVAPWAAWMLASVMLLFAAIGAVRAFRDGRPSLAAITIAFGPYLLFDVLFQETFTTRYALPLVVPIAYLAATGARALPRQSGVVAAILVVMFAAHVGGTSVAAYARQPAPAFRLFDDMMRAAGTTASTPTLAMDRREALDLQKAMRWSADRLPAFAAQLPSPPMHEWLEPVKYWNSGGPGPLWYVADPLRTDIDLIQHREPMAYRWPLPYPVLIGGARPGEMDWYRLDRPDWFVGEGWSLTPETAGVADAEHRGLINGSIEGRVAQPLLDRGAVVVGGRNFEPTVRPQLTITIGSAWTRTFPVMPGPFVNIYALPVIDGQPLPGYLPITIASVPPARVAIEQFDAAWSRPVIAFAGGWHEPEFSEPLGRWRWLSERGELPFVLRRPASSSASDARRFLLHVEGESPLRYFSRPSRLAVRAGDRVVDTRTLDADFAFDVALPFEAYDPAGRGTLTLETDQTFVPAERWWLRTRDRRRLGLRIFKCEIRVTTDPAR